MDQYWGSLQRCCVAVLSLAFATASCGGSTVKPTPQAVVALLASVSISATSAIVGATLQGTVSLDNPAPTNGANVTLASDSGAITVAPSVLIAAGSTNQTFTANAAAPGSAIVTATYNGKTLSTDRITVTAPPPTAALQNLSLNPGTVTAGGTSTGTVTLTAAAPTGGAAVSLSSGNSAAITVPAAVTIPAGGTTATFVATAQTIAASTTVTVTASYAGKSTTASITITPAPVALTAKFDVSSPSGSNTCTLKADTTLDCTFDGSQSTGTIQAWLWTQVLGTKNINTTTTTARLSATTGGCTLFSGQKVSETILMEVHLRVRDGAGNLSDDAVNKSVTIKPVKGVCNF